MGGTGVIDRFLEVFTRYIDSGFGLLQGEVKWLAGVLIAIDLVLAALFWAMAPDEDVIARLVKKTLFIGVFAYIINNWTNLARIVFESFAGLGLKASGTGLSEADFLRPGRVAQVGLDAGKPILDSISGLMGFVSFFENFIQIAVLLFAWAIVILAFFILAIQLFVSLIEFKLTTLAGFVLIPFGLFNKTAFAAERVLGNVMSSGIKVLVLAVIVGIGTTLFSQFTQGFAGQPTIEDAMGLVLAALSLLGLGIFGPGVANGIISGGPQLGAGAAVGTGLAAGGLVRRRRRPRRGRARRRARRSRRRCGRSRTRRRIDRGSRDDRLPHRLRWTDRRRSGRERHRRGRTGRQLGRRPGCGKPAPPRRFSDGRQLSFGRAQRLQGDRRHDRRRRRARRSFGRHHSVDRRTRLGARHAPPPVRPPECFHRCPRRARGRRRRLRLFRLCQRRRVMFFKRTDVRYGRTPEPETPYQRAAQAWDDRIGSGPRPGEELAADWRSARCFSPAAWPPGSSGSRRPARSCLGSCRSTGWVKRRPSRPPMRHTSRPIRKWRGISRGSWRRSAPFRPTPSSCARTGCGLTTTRRARARWRSAITPAPTTRSPSSAGSRSRSTSAASSAPRPPSFRVAWTERRFQDGALAATERWTAILTVAIQTPRDPETLKKNPLGVYVTALNWSKELG